MTTPVNKLRSVNPITHSSMPDTNNNNNFLTNCRRADDGHHYNTPCSVNYDIEIINRSAHDVYLKDREGFSTRLGRYLGNEKRLL